MFNVYGIFCKTTWRVYYGSTEFIVEQRLKSHENNYKRYLKGKYDYITSFEILKNNNYEIKLLEKCDNEIHMCNRERFYIKTFPCVNKYRGRVPGRTYKEWREDNREELAEKNKEWREDNREKFLEKQREYREENKVEIAEKRKQKITCPCGSTLTIKHKARHEKSIKHKKYLENL